MIPYGEELLPTAKAISKPCLKICADMCRYVQQERLNEIRALDENHVAGGIIVIAI